MDNGFTVGIIGLGDMGKMYARRLSGAGWRVLACDRPERCDELRKHFEGATVRVLENGHLVSRQSDYIIYMVEAENIGRVVQLYGESTKYGSIVGGQTSCKAPEISAFEQNLPKDAAIVSCHSLHGPNVDPTGQPLVIIQHRASPEQTAQVERVLSCLKSTVVRLSAEEHDRITADTQAVTHAAFLSMGVAWKANDQFPWEIDRHTGGIENVKINVTLRIFSNKWHVYAGLAILNPAAQHQIQQYATSVTSLFTLLLEGRNDEFAERVRTAGKAVFGDKVSNGDLLLRDDVLDKFSLGSIPLDSRRPNNHLSLLAMVDCWWRLGIDPYSHMICSTPLFRLWLGVTEYVYRQPAILDDTIRIASTDTTFRSDDLEFTMAARVEASVNALVTAQGWSECVSHGNFESYRLRFESTQAYFAPRFKEATRIGNEMIKTILQNIDHKP